MESQEEFSVCIPEKRGLSTYEGNVVAETLIFFQNKMFKRFFVLALVVAMLMVLRLDSTEGVLFVVKKNKNFCFQESFR